jgi:hypothetical protein
MIRQLSIDEIVLVSGGCWSDKRSDDECPEHNEIPGDECPEEPPEPFPLP